MAPKHEIMHQILRTVATSLVAMGWTISTEAGDPDDASLVRRAIAYLDARQDEWSRFDGAQRGEGAGKTACVSCHTGVSYALGRPALRPFAVAPGLAAQEQRLIAAVNLRVEHRAELDSPEFGLMYDHTDRKKVESRGTEAVLNALILARDDAKQGRTAPGSATRAALDNLWSAQIREGANSGSWDWLTFGLEPWEGKTSRGFGAALAAIAVGSAPGYLAEGSDGAASAGVRSLGDYLRKRFPDETLYNRLWVLEASATFPGLLSPDAKREVIEQLLAKRRDDGGWALADLGNYPRVDGSAQSHDSDGYATGLALRTLLHAGVPPARPEVAQGLAWLRSHQKDDGSWPGRSVNKERNPTTFIGRLMSDAATAMAATVLIEAESR